MELVQCCDFNKTHACNAKSVSRLLLQKWEYHKFVSTPETGTQSSVRNVSLSEMLKQAAAHTTPAALFYSVYLDALCVSCQIPNEELK